MCDRNSHSDLQALPCDQASTPKEQPCLPFPCLALPPALGLGLGWKASTWALDLSGAAPPPMEPHLMALRLLMGNTGCASGRPGLRILYTVV